MIIDMMLVSHMYLVLKWKSLANVLRNKYPCSSREGREGSSIFMLFLDSAFQNNDTVSYAGAVGFSMRERRASHT